MIRLIFALTLLAPSPTQESPYKVPDLIHAAYQAGIEDATYRTDDIGLVRLTLKDIEEAI